MMASWVTKDKEQDPIWQVSNIHKLKPQNKTWQAIFDFYEIPHLPAALEWLGTKEQHEQFQQTDRQTGCATNSLSACLALQGQPNSRMFDSAALAGGTASFTQLS